MPASRRFLLKAAGAAAIAVVSHGRAGLSVRAAQADPLAAWQAAPAAMHSDPRLRALAWAVLAPNPHNRQPWIAELPSGRSDLVVLRCDLERRLPVTDPFDRQITIGLGAFAELYRLAAADEGRAVDITAFPESEPAPRLDGRPVAVLRLGPPGSARAEPLFRQAAARRSSKVPYDMAHPISAATIAEIAAAAATTPCAGTGDPDRVAALRDIAWRAWNIEARTEAAHRESVDLMRLGRAEVAASPDGISLWGPHLEAAIAAGQLTRDALLPGRPGYAMMVARYEGMLAATPAYVWMTTAANSRAEQFAAGRDWLRVNLAATERGLGLHPVSQALQEFDEMRLPYAEIHAALAPGGTVQMLGRLGSAPAVPATPRWPMETRLRAV